jgi:antitoxin VapB
MALSIKSDEADRLARELASLTGESITDAVTVALRERLDRQRSRRVPRSELTRRIAERLSTTPVLDARDPDAILGYDDRGLPS